MGGVVLGTGRNFLFNALCFCSNYLSEYGVYDCVSGVVCVCFLKTRVNSRMDAKSLAICSQSTRTHTAQNTPVAEAERITQAENKSKTHFQRKRRGFIDPTTWLPPLTVEGRGKCLVARAITGVGSARDPGALDGNIE